MFSRILIANRGEIAVRLIRACHEAGIGSVAVYSDADRNSLHVRLANQARRIGPPPSAESYLKMDAIIEAAKDSGAEAIHPGYGFLAENADFAERCAQEGLVFIGPSPEAVALMGDKAQAREVAIRAGVPIVPGTEPLETEDQASSAAKEIGFPLLVKATAGGGGKGMRRVDDPGSLSSSFAQARSEAQSSFGDPSVYLEKLVERPRHIEFQIVADAAGGVVHLMERECSIQRRHQKLIEEAPSPFLDETLRQRMGSAAVSLAREAGYTNAGTVEFLVDDAGSFYFLEMNARLQVEHPITELVTGVDLVQLQLAIANGGALPFGQDDVPRRGWAMEFRITAENPFDNFAPSAGRIGWLRPAGGPGVRDDSGVYEGWEVTPHYDPLIAKLIVAGDDRAHCLARARRAVREYQVHGIATTLPFFERMLDDSRFVAGDLDVGFVDRHWMSELAGPAERLREKLFPVALAAAAVTLPERATLAARDGEERTTGSVWKRLGWQEQVSGRF